MTYIHYKLREMVLSKAFNCNDLGVILSNDLRIRDNCKANTDKDFRAL